MPDASNAKIEFEAGQSLSALAAMTDSGDHTVFTISGAEIWSGKSGYTPTITPNGIVSGNNVLSVHATDDVVTVAGFTAYSKGVLKTVSATTATITRPGTAEKAQIVSVTMASDGSIAVVEGTIGTTTSFSETRDAAGGPPYIPADSVEIGQIRTTAMTSAAIAASEIKQVIGTHVERYDYPVWTVNRTGDGDQASAAAKKNAYVELVSALSAIHTAGAYKKVYATVYEPSFQEVQEGKSFKAPGNTHSVNSEQFYRVTKASTSSTLGQGSFTALVSNGVNDSLVALQDEILTFRFYPDEDESPYVIAQGKLGIVRAWEPDAQNKADCTISAESKAVNFSS